MAAGALARTKPGSRARGYVELLIDLVAAEGRGVTLDEFRTAYLASALPRSSVLEAEFYSLVRRGVVTAVGGRPQHTLYAPAGARITRARPADDAQRVLEALHAVYQRLRRAVSAREVAEELRRAGASFHAPGPNVVRKRLETLSRTRTRGPREARAAAVVRLAFPSAVGRPLVYWAPAESDAMRVPSVGQRATVLSPRSGVDPLRQRLGEACHALRRPVTRGELRLWMRRWDLAFGTVEPRWTGTPDVALASRLATLLRADGDALQPGRARAIATPWTCHGGAPLRYAAGAVDPETVVALELEDAAAAFALEREMAGIAALERRAQQMRSETLGEVAWLRRALVQDRLHAILRDQPARAVLRRLRRTLDQLTAWPDPRLGLRPGQHEHITRGLQRRRADVDALTRALEVDIRTASPPTRLCIVGEAGLTTAAALKPYIDALATAKRETPDRVLRWLAPVRRFPAPDETRRERFRTPGTSPLSLLDRPDALVTCVGVVAGPRTRELLVGLRNVLGWVLRDPKELRARVLALDLVDAFPRRAGVLMLGLLSEPVSWEEGVLDADRVDDVAAWALSIILSGTAGAIDQLGEAQGRARGDSRRVLQQAIMRVRLGYPLTAVE